MDRRYVAGLGLAAALLVGCSACATPYPLPDRRAADVQAEEQRLTALLPGALLSAPGRCAVRLLGRDGDTSYAWARCDDVEGAGLSMPVRVDGDRVTEPEDGVGYAPSVHRMFPDRLADLVLDEPDEVRP